MRRIASIFVLASIIFAMSPGEWWHDCLTHDHEHHHDHGQDEAPAEDEHDCFVCDFELLPVLLSDAAVTSNSTLLESEFLIAEVQDHPRQCILLCDGRGPPMA